MECTRVVCRKRNVPLKVFHFQFFMRTRFSESVLKCDFYENQMLSKRLINRCVFEDNFSKYSGNVALQLKIQYF